MTKSFMIICRMTVTLVLILTTMTYYKDSVSGLTFEGQCEKKQKIMFLKTHKVNQTSRYCKCLSPGHKSYLADTFYQFLTNLFPYWKYISKHEQCWYKYTTTERHLKTLNHGCSLQYLHSFAKQHMAKH